MKINVFALLFTLLIHCIQICLFVQFCLRIPVVSSLTSSSLSTNTTLISPTSILCPSVSRTSRPFSAYRTLSIPFSRPSSPVPFASPDEKRGSETARDSEAQRWQRLPILCYLPCVLPPVSSLSYAFCDSRFSLSLTISQHPCALSRFSSFFLCVWPLSQCQYSIMCLR